MKAIELTKYGAPENLQMKEVEKPLPKENEILIKIHATSVSSGDARMRRADPFIIRLIFGFKRPRKSVLGVVVAGEIEATGKNVSNYKIGDQVFGSSGMSFGAHAEYVSVPEDAVLALKPTNMTYEEAAAIPFGGTASLHFLRIANIQPGQKVLIYGASGALGTMAVQLARNYGAEITAVCSTSNIELMKSLGADKVIDYTQEDFTQNGKFYDRILDVKTDRSVFDYRRALSSNGIYVTVGGNSARILQLVLLGSLMSMTGSKQLSLIMHKPNRDLNILKELFESGKMKPVVDRCFALNATAEAFQYFGAGHFKGKVVISIVT